MCICTARIDARFLYTNIPNFQSIAEIKFSLDEKTNKTVSAKVIIAFLALILTLNNFAFN